MTPAHCPNCGIALGVPDHLVGREIRCGKCGSDFIAQPQPADVPAPQPVAVEPMPSSIEDHLTCGAELDRPARRRRRWEFDREAAHSRVQAPGILMMIVGCLFALGGLGCAIVAVIGIVELTGLHGENGRDAEKVGFTVILGLVGMITMLGAGAVMIVGGHQLRTLGNKGWVIAAAVVAIAITALGCMPLLIPVGALSIWALIVLTNPDVKGAMETRSVALD